MKKVLILAALAAGAVASAEVPPAHVADFETGDLSQWDKLDIAPGTTDRLTVVASPTAQGLFALKATVKKGDLINNGARAEVVLTDQLFDQGDETWFHWFTMFPADYQPAPQWVLFTQWHSDNPYGVPLGFNLHGTEMSLRVMGHKYDGAGQWNAGTLWSEPMVTGRWMEFLLHVRWSKGNDGFVEMWKDGQLVVQKTYHQTLDPDDYVYLKLGLYRHKDIAHAQSVLHDGMTVYRSEPTHLTRPPEPEPEPEEPADEEPTDEGEGTPSDETPTDEPTDDDASTDGSGDAPSDQEPTADTPAEPDAPAPRSQLAEGQAGCSATGAAPWLFGLVIVAVPAMRRRWSRR